MCYYAICHDTQVTKVRPNLEYAARQAIPMGATLDAATLNTLPSSSTGTATAAASLSSTPSLPALRLTVNASGQPLNAAFPPFKKTTTAPKGKGARRSQSDEEPEASSSEESDQDVQDPMEVDEDDSDFT